MNIEFSAANLVPHAKDIIFFFVVLIFSFISGILLKRFTVSIHTTKSGNNSYVANLIGNIIKVTIWLLGAVTALGTIGVNISALIGGLGLTGFALGFALKDILTNTLSGLLLLVYRPVKLRDYIEVDKYSGTVVSIDLRYLTLESEDNKILIPNGKVFSSSISIKK